MEEDAGAEADGAADGRVEAGVAGDELLGIRQGVGGGEAVAEVAGDGGVVGEAGHEGGVCRDEGAEEEAGGLEDEAGS